MRTLALTTDIPESREVRFTLPGDIPTGPADVVLLISSAQEVSESRVRTFRDLLASGFVGSWRERVDVGDSAEYAARLREESWRLRYASDDSAVDHDAAR